MTENVRRPGDNVQLDYKTYYNGEVKYIHSKMKCLEGASGQTYIMVTLLDVTGDKRSDRRNQSIIGSIAKAFFALYHFSLIDGVFTALKTPDDIKDEIRGVTKLQDFYDIYITNYVHEEFRDAVTDFFRYDTIRENLKNDEFAVIEFKRKNVGWSRITLIVADRDFDGDVISVVFAATTIEKQKILEIAQQEALQSAYESANIANAAKTDFLSKMSHDIRTPMNAIIGMTAIASAHLDEIDRVRDCLSKIDISSKHLLGIINDVLDMSKIESGKMELHEDEFNVSDLVDNLVIMSKPQIDAKHHSLAVSMHDIEHAEVLGDSQRLQQVFMNIMSNAIKYTPEGGTITLTVTEKPIEKASLGYYIFEFEDNGIGISEEYLASIFDPFTRSMDDIRVNDIQGTGLGMAITKNIVQMMNGDVTIESKLNEGTRVIIELFFKINQAKADAASRPIPDNTGTNKKETSVFDLNTLKDRSYKGKRALLVEDNALNAEIATEILGMVGLEIERAVNGKDALEIMKSVEDGHFDIVFMDIQMPIMNGHESAHAIRALDSSYAKTVPIIAMTANAFAEDIATAKNAGMNAHISKPLDIDCLMRALDRWLR